MKKINLFVCELCGAQYKEEATAAKCEKNHKKIVNITSTRYLSLASNRTGYPSYIEVLLDNGEHLTFKR